MKRRGVIVALKAEHSDEEIVRFLKANRDVIINIRKSLNTA